MDNTPYGCYFIPMKPDIEKRATKRLRSIQGQIDGIIKMMDADMYCIDVLTQFKAIQSALASTKNIILEGYMESCMLTKVRGGKEKEAFEELMAIVRFEDKR